MGTKLFVGNLSYSITEQELREAFSQSGRNVQSAAPSWPVESGPCPTSASG